MLVCGLLFYTTLKCYDKDAFVHFVGKMAHCLRLQKEEITKSSSYKLQVEFISNQKRTPAQFNTLGDFVALYDPYYIVGTGFGPLELLLHFLFFALIIIL